MNTQDISINKGLAGIYADYSAISNVNLETNSLLYRGYPVQDLAEQKSFEEVAWLLLHGELPSREELQLFEQRERQSRRIPTELLAILDALPVSSHPMDLVRTAVSALGAHDSEWADDSPEGNMAKSEKIFALLPSVIAYIQRRRRGEKLIDPRPDLNYSENFLWMTFGTIPDDTVVKAFTISMILYAEHSFNASTFTARVITSTLSDLYSAVVGAIGALKGHLHGGANEAVMATLEEIGLHDDPASRVGPWLDEKLAAKAKIMGFGHRVYRLGDSRVPTMREALESLIDHFDRPEMRDLYCALEDAMVARTGILPNLDYPSGPAYHLMGFDTEIFTPLFVASRVTGWCSHIMEQRASNSLIRPLAAYNGPDQRAL